MRRVSDIHFYLYRSQSKIDMLYQQIDGFDPTAHVEQKISTIESALGNQGLLGTLDEPKAYVSGQMRMRWGLFNDNGTRPQDEAPLVFFGGVDKTRRLVVGLGGSSVHVTGHEGASSTYSRSTTPTIVRWILSGIYGDEPPAVGWADDDAEEQLVLGSVPIALYYLRPPSQDLIFLAKVLLSGRTHGNDRFVGIDTPFAILGTPIYVRQVTPLHDDDRFGLDAEWEAGGANG